MSESEREKHISIHHEDEQGDEVEQEAENEHDAMSEGESSEAERS